MKTIILTLLLCCSINAMADADDDMHTCSLNSAMYESVAGWRDRNVSPETALQFSESYKEIDLQNRKKIINLVYFDPAFERAGGPALRMQMLKLCLNGPKNWKPLK